ncbi:ABC transporter permease [Novisyntrophococcus fermenticellae]|uniref:ABC transporter permease n=1 Tax=Novisyntrophococcus fermenticellae TaxID=2068655 RepID=UPI001E4F0AE2|nr:ABC transporter permease [Novisyntrophococcus fermenticellae]
MDSQKITLTEDMFHRVGTNEQKSESVVRPSISYWQDAWRRLKQNKVALFSMCFLIFMVLMCIFAPYIYPHAYDEQMIEHTNQVPTAQHIFGLDDLGRDIFARVWVGGRVSLAIGLVGAVISLVVGVIYGGISGYFGGTVDNLMMRIVEVLVGIPYMIVVILVSIVLGKGMGSLIIALCLTSWTGLARLVRGQILNLMESEYILAAKALGTPTYKIIFKHLLPNTLSVIIVNTTFSIPSFIFAESFLSFIGMGIQPPNTSWGAMAALGQQQMSYYPHELLFPALAISLTMLAFNLLGDGLRDAFDPKLRQ